MNGVNPLGLGSEQCYQVPADVINNLHGRNGIKHTEISLSILTVMITVPCQLGYVRVCNSNTTTPTNTAICPAGAKEVRNYN